MIIDQPKQRVKIITSDPTTRTIEGRLRDGGVVQIATWEVGPSFRWPLPDEIWAIKRENNFWVLKDRIHSSLEPFPVDDLNPGELRLDSEDIRDAAGRNIISVYDDETTEGDILIKGAIGWTTISSNEIIDASGDLLSGSGVPDNGLGVVGDFYLDTLNGRLYGPKTTTWGSYVIRSGPGKYTQSVGSVTAGTPLTITHGLNTRDVIVAVYEQSTFEDVECDVKRTGVNTISLTFSAAHSSGTYSVVVIG